MENNNLKMFINNDGNQFYSKWRKDTIQGLIIAPIFFLFFALIFTMIIGESMKLLYVLIWPLILTIVLFIYVPFFVRKKYVNKMVKSILIEDNTISIETFKWFKFDSIKESTLIYNIEIRESIGISFFKGRKIYLLNVKGWQDKAFYIVNDFFDNIGIIEKLSK